jgi:cobalamin biosynthesis protein CbiD
MTKEEKEDDPYVIHGSNLVAEVSTTAHPDLVTFLEREGVSVSSEHGVTVDFVRIRISGHSAKTLNHAMTKLRDQNPQIRLRIVDDED